MSRRVIVLGGALVVVSGILLWLFLAGGSSAPVALKGVNAGASAAPRQTMPSADVQHIQHDLDNAALPTQADAVATEWRDAFLQGGQPMLPADTDVTIKPDTFRARGDTATVVATTSAGESYTLHLVHEVVDGVAQWRILYTDTTP